MSLVSDHLMRGFLPAEFCCPQKTASLAALFLRMQSCSRYARRQRFLQVEDPKESAIGSNSIPNPFHIFEQNLLTAVVIEFRGSAVGVAGDSLSGFKGAVIFQKVRDAGRPK